MSSQPSLSVRQQHVYELMIQGLPSRLIAEQLGISVNTVKEHRRAILQRMQVDNTVALIHKIQQSGVNSRHPSLADDLAKSPEVLVVEDDDHYRELVVSSLKLSGLGCRGFACSAELEAALSEQKADVVILDLNLGEEDGLVIAQELRETRPDIGIIMMTVRGMVEQRIEGLLVGADAYLVKPVDIRELAGVIRNLYRRLVEARVMAPG